MIWLAQNEACCATSLGTDWHSQRLMIGFHSADTADDWLNRAFSQPSAILFQSNFGTPGVDGFIAIPLKIAANFSKYGGFRGFAKICSDF